MILADTSVWIDHFRAGQTGLESLLNQGQVMVHPFVMGELACGNLANREEVLGLLDDLPESPLASQDEVLYFIEQHALMGRGIGWIDAHLLAATAIAATARLWTRDKALQRVATQLDLDYA